MSFLSDLFKGNTSNLGSDLSNPFADTAKSFDSQPAWLRDTEIAVPAAIAAFTAPEWLPALGTAAGIGGAGAGGAAVAAGASGAADAAAAGAPLDLLSFGSAAGTADAAAVGTDLGITGATGALDFTSGATDALSLLNPAAGGLSSDAGISAINTAVPLGDTASAVTPGLSSTDLAGITTNYGVDTNVADLPASSPSFFQQLVQGATNSVTKNPLGILASGAGLGLSLLRGNQTDPNQAQLQAEAPGLQAQGAALTASGQNLQTYLTNGTLPPGLQAQVTNAVQAAKARIIANHAANGENTNPTQNSALAQELSQVDLNGIAQAGTLEQQLFQSDTQLLQTGLSETGLSEQIYETLVKMDQTNNNALMASIASMAAALGGGTKIQIGGTQAAA